MATLVSPIVSCPRSIIAADAMCTGHSLSDLPVEACAAAPDATQKMEKEEKEEAVVTPMCQ